MLRPLLGLFLLLSPVLWAAESVATKAEADYRARRQAALTGQWMEVKLPFDTPATYLARLLDTAREGDSRAMAALGWEFYQRKDASRARSWLRQAAEKDNLFAAYLLGLLDQTPMAANPAGAESDGSGLKLKPREPDEDTILPKIAPSPATATEPSEQDGPKVDWMKKAADGGLAEARFEIGLRHMQGKDAPLDPQAARQWYLRAAEQKYAPALCNLATMELQGTGGPADLEAAAAHFQTAAGFGFPQAFFGVGEANRLREQYAQAAAGYERAAEAGLVEADFWLGCLSSQALGVPKDEAKAARHFLTAAKGGHLFSRAIAADLLRHGTGIPADSAAAAHWDAEIAKITNADLLASIGTLYLEGRLVQRDLSKALGYLRRAAAQGQPVAQRWAGALLASGEAGERDLGEAYQWLWLAARNGQPDAEPAFRAVLQAMSGPQIMDGARRASEFQPTKTPPEPTPSNPEPKTEPTPEAK